MEKWPLTIAQSAHISRSFRRNHAEETLEEDPHAHDPSQQPSSVPFKVPENMAHRLHTNAADFQPKGRLHYQWDDEGQHLTQGSGERTIFLHRDNRFLMWSGVLTPEGKRDIIRFNQVF